MELNNKIYSIKVLLAGDAQTGKKELFKSFQESFKGDNNSDISKGIYYIKNKKFKLTIDISNNPDKANDFLKHADLVFLCFRTDNNDSFLNLAEWIIAFSKFNINDYSLIANSFKSPYYSIKEIQNDCELLNDNFKPKYLSLYFNDFSNVETVRLLFEKIVLSSDFNIKKENHIQNQGHNCKVF